MTTMVHVNIGIGLQTCAVYFTALKIPQRGLYFLDFQVLEINSKL